MERADRVGVRNGMTVAMVRDGNAVASVHIEDKP